MTVNCNIPLLTIHKYIIYFLYNLFLFLYNTINIKLRGMLKMKRFKSTIILIVFILLFAYSEGFFDYFSEINLNPFDYARITDVDYKAVLVDEPGSNGKVVITERLTFDIHAASKDNLFWELWRDLPESYIDGVKVDYQVNSVKQILNDGSEIIYSESPKLYWDDSDYTSTYRRIWS